MLTRMARMLTRWLAGSHIIQNRDKVYLPQRAKRVVSDSPGLVDFAILCLTCPTGK